MVRKLLIEINLYVLVCVGMPSTLTCWGLFYLTKLTIIWQKEKQLTKILQSRSK